MNEPSNISVPIPSTDGKFGKKAASNESNPFGFAESDETHFWYVSLISCDKRGNERDTLCLMFWSRFAATGHCKNLLID